MLSKLYFYLRDKIQELELHLSGLIQKRLAVSANSRLFYFSAIYLNLKLVLFEVVSDLIKFLVIVFADPAQGFKLFYNQRDLQACPYSYSGFRQVQKKIRVFSTAGLASIIVVAVITSLVTNLIFGGKNPGQAATFGWSQDTWSSGATTTYPKHINPNNQAGWPYYAAKDAGTIVTGVATGTVQLLSMLATTTQTDDTDFSSGTTTNATTSGSGVGAGVQLKKLETANSWTALRNVPAATNDGSLVYDGNGNFYGLIGNQTASFYRYNVASDTWTQMASTPAVSGGVYADNLLTGGMVYDENGNIFLARGNGKNDFWKYNIASNAWTVMASVPGVVTVVSGNSVFDGNGNIYLMKGNSTGELWKYNIAYNSWTQMASYGNGVKAGAMSYDGNGNLFLMEGNGRNGFVKYNIASNTWSLRAVTPATTYMSAMAYDGKGSMYALHGYGTADFWKYNIETNTWATMTPALAAVGNNGEGKSGALAFDRNGNFYAFGGINTQNFWKYSIYDNYASSGTFESGTIDMQKKVNLSSLAFNQTLNGATLRYQLASSDSPSGPWNYFGPNGSGATYFTSSGQATPAALNGHRYVRYKVFLTGGGAGWSALASTPSAVGAGGSLAYDGNGGIYAYKGGGNTAFWKYSIATATWATLAPSPTGVGDGGALIGDEKGGVYALPGGGSTALYQFVATSGTWSLLAASLTANMWYGAAIAYDKNDSLYMLRGWSSQGFLKYNIASNTVAWISTVPLYVSSGGAVAYDNNGSVFAFPGNNQASFVRYSATTSSWTTIASAPPPSAINAGGALVYDNNKNLYAFGGGNTVNFWKYNMLTNTWSALASTSAGVGGGGSLTYDYNGNIYALRGNGTGDFWKYSFRTTATPVLNDISINYSYFSTSSTLTSSWYNTTDVKNTISRITWNETASLASSTRVKFQLRTAISSSTDPESPATSTAWQGPDGTANSFFTSTSTGCSKDGSGNVSCAVSALTTTVADSNDDQWMQYQVTLESAGNETPTADSVNVQYVVNNAPDFQAGSFVAFQSTTTGQLEMAYSVHDSDTDNGTIHRNIVDIGLQYWNGSGWTTASTSLIAFNTGTSAVAVASTSYIGYSLIYDAVREPGLAGRFMPGQLFRVVANDGEAANNLGYATTSILVDTQKPSAGSVIIKANVVPAQVTLSATDSSHFMMKLSTDPTFADVPSWQEYSSNPTFTVSSSTASLYVLFRDDYNNYASTSIAIPSVPRMVMIQDTSNIIDTSSPEYRLFISWKRPVVSNFKQYNIYRSYGTDTPPDLIGISSDYNVNYFTDVTMASGTEVYYFASVETASGSVSYLSDKMWGNANGIQDRGEGGGGSGSVSSQPAITNILSTSTFSNQAVIEWDTDVVSDSLVFYTTVDPNGDWSAVDASSTGQATLVDNAGNYGKHRVVLTNLIPDTDYFFKVQSVNINDVAGYVDRDSSAIPLSFKTLAGPSITPGSVEVTSLSNHTVGIAWKTDQSANLNSVIFATSTDENGNLVDPVEIQSGWHNVSGHLVKIDRLVPGTTYLYYVKSDNSIDKQTVGTNDRFYWFTTTRDTIAPSIAFSPEDINPTDHSVVVQFATDKPATSSVTISAGAFSTTSESSSFNSSNRYLLDGLAPATDYNILITATDQNGNTGATSSSFTTKAAPDTAGPTISTTTDWLAPSPDHAVITFHTNDENGTGYVEYANSTSSFETVKLEIGSDQLSANHIINLAGLSQNQTYYFRLRSADASGNISYSPTSSAGEYYQFTTVPGPTISSISSSTTETSATISWHTSEPSDGYVIYGTPSLASGWEKGNSTTSLDHTVTISGLVPGTAYQYRLRSTNESKGLTVYPEGSTLGFTTDLGPLTISNATSTSISDQGAVIAWDVSRAAQSLVYYGTSSLASSSPSQVAASTAFTTNPAVILGGLASSTTYYFRIVNTDNLGRVATSTEEYSFTTKEPQHGQAEIDALTRRVAELEATLNGRSDLSKEEVARLQTELERAKSSGGGGAIIIDKNDKLAPQISSISISSLTATSAVISWLTNEDASSFVNYGLSSNYEDAYGVPALTKTHKAILKNLLPGTDYRYLVSSVDGAGNLAVANESTFTTPSLTPEEALGLGSSTPDAAVTPQLVEMAANKVVDLMTSLSHTVSLGSFETTILSQFDALNKLAQIIPGPVLGGEPATEITPTTVTIKWKTDKPSNSMVAYAPEILFAQSKGNKGYLQLVGEPNQSVTDHAVKIVGLKPDFIYHYQLRSKGRVGSETISRDFTFRTKPEALEIISVNTETLSKDKAKFSWLTSQETDTELTYIPFRNGRLSSDEIKVVREKAMTTSHEVQVNDLEAGVVYQLQIAATDQKGIKISKTISFFSTTKDDLPPEISDIQTESALSQSKDAKVQTIMTWTTNEPTVSQIRYAKGVFEDEKDLNEETPLETVYSRKHTIVITKFEIGEVYSFRVVATDSGGNQSVSSPHIVLTPRQKEGVFELIINTFESTFGWLGQMK
jgi:hypothetical protein